MCPAAHTSPVLLTRWGGAAEQCSCSIPPPPPRPGIYSHKPSPVAVCAGGAGTRALPLRRGGGEGDSRALWTATGGKEVDCQHFRDLMPREASHLTLPHLLCTAPRGLNSSLHKLYENFSLPRDKHHKQTQTNTNKPNTNTNTGLLISIKPTFKEQIKANRNFSR